ncbi:MAG: hypothetical protein PHU21_02460 [Elusimicrobia bacterium]|nr:hypothetical protein [Elusimicrobiota bacterium]
MARPILGAVLTVILAAPALAAGPEQARLEFLTPALSEGLLRIQQASPRWTHVNMNIYGSQSFYEVSDYSLRINLRGSRSSGGQFFFNGSAGSQYLNLNAYPRNSQDLRQGYTLSGAYVNLSIDRSGSSYSINGWVNHKSIWLQAMPHAGGGFSLYGQMGLNLNIMGSGQRLWVTGNVDLSQFDETSLAALGAVLSVLDSMPPQSK